MIVSARAVSGFETNPGLIYFYLENATLTFALTLSLTHSLVCESWLWLSPIDSYKHNTYVLKLHVLYQSQPEEESCNNHAARLAHASVGMFRQIQWEM